MNNFWDFIDNVNKRSLLVKSLVLGITFYAGMGLNATYGFIDWVRLPYNNKRDIVILMEKSQEITSISDSMRDLRAEMDKRNADTLDLVGKVRKLEDGQLRLFLQVERIDERTLNLRSK